MNRKKIVAICGSTKSTSVNLNLIKAITELVKDDVDVEIFDRIAEIPHFNPDLDHENPPAQVIAFRNTLRQADAILISTPEYAMGVPGTLKNALDWTVSSCEFSKKPVALITASSLGEKGHASLLETLKIIESDISEKTQLLISHAKTKIGDSVIKDQDTLRRVQQLLEELRLSMQQTTWTLAK